MHSTSGVIVREVATGGQVKSSPTFCSQSRCFYVGSHSGKVVAVPIDVSFPAWFYESNDPIFSSPVLDQSQS
jgi:hypothetical protein